MDHPEILRRFPIPRSKSRDLRSKGRENAAWRLFGQVPSVTGANSNPHHQLARIAVKVYANHRQIPTRDDLRRKRWYPFTTGLAFVRQGTVGGGILGGCRGRREQSGGQSSVCLRGGACACGPQMVVKVAEVKSLKTNARLTATEVREP